MGECFLLIPIDVQSFKLRMTKKGGRIGLSKDRRPAEKIDFDKIFALLPHKMDVDVPAKQGLHSSTSLHCIAEIRAHWAETKPSITLDIITRLFDNAAFVLFRWWQDFLKI